MVEAKPDYIIVAAFGQLVPKRILDIAPSINLHASLLPKYRGASPVQEAILNGDKFTGVTAMLMDEGLDSGDILAYRFFKIPDDVRLPELMSKLTDLASVLTIGTRLKDLDRIIFKFFRLRGYFYTLVKRLRRGELEGCRILEDWLQEVILENFGAF